VETKVPLTDSTLRSPADAYAAIAELYDLEHGDFADDLDLYLNLALVVGDPILEIGCGTGRVALPLARAGHRVTGTDRSEAMLDRARAAAEREGLADRLRLLAGDMAEASAAPGGPFGLAIVALNGLLHLETASAQRAALCSLRDALDPRGQLVIDVLNPTPDALRALEGVHHEGSWTRADGTRVDKLSARRLHHVDQTIFTDLWYDLTAPDGSVRRAATSFTMRYVHRAELELMLELAGFVECQVYGSYDLDPPDDRAERLIVTAEVTPSP
jgi:SAM-dependent methyltransferase